MSHWAAWPSPSHSVQPSAETCLRCSGYSPKSIGTHRRSRISVDQGPQDCFAPNVAKASANTCKRCSEQVPKYTMEAGTHACSACERTFPKEHWKPKTLENHRSPQDSRLVCTECGKRGYSPKDVENYWCARCEEDWGHSKFEKVHLNDAKRPERQGGTAWGTGQINGESTYHI